jgi:hypothetical protein
MLKFPEWYYGGPFSRVADPNRDLPRRLDGASVDEATIRRIEFDGNLDGERLVAPFHDANTLHEILASIELVACYPDCWDEDELFYYPTLQGSLAEAEDRIRDRMRRTKATTKLSAYSSALRDVATARLLIAEGRHAEASDLLWGTANLLQESNSAHRGQPRELPPPKEPTPDASGVSGREHG